MDLDRFWSKIQGGFMRSSLLALIMLSFSFTAFASQKISIMSYNVENLFDTIKDEDRNDWEYLPRSQKNTREQKEFCMRQDPKYQDDCLHKDWNDKVVAEKMTRIADTILQINGVGPDILILAEVENIRVLKQLNDNYLQKAGYKTVELIEGDDRRGIDIGILSRLPLAGTPVLNRIKFTHKPLPKTRGIMEVPLQLPNGETLYVLGVHFPSQANPREQRVDAVNTLNEILAAKGNARVIVGGDFNITKEEDIEAKLFTGTLANNWQVSHLVGCKSCEGSHYFKGSWSFLDALLFSPSLDSNKGVDWRLDVDSIVTPTAGKYQMRNGVPSRFNEKYPTGVSDHLPMYGEILVQ